MILCSATNAQPAIAGRIFRYGPINANFCCSECGFRWRADELQAWLLGQEEPLTEATLAAEIEQERQDKG